MAYIEYKNDQVCLPIDQPVTTSRWLKLGIACFWGICVALMFCGASVHSEPTRPMTSAAESTDLMALSAFGSKPGIMNANGRTNFMGLSSFRGNSGILNAMGRLPGSSPFKRIALSAIEANNIGKQGRDVSMMASTEVNDKLKDEVSNLDDENKAEVAKVVETVAMKAKNMAGVTAPMGFFDPLGFSTDCSEGKLLFYREVELKHGRVAMLAALGILVGEQFHPLFGGDIDVPSYIAFQQTPLQKFWPAVALAIAIPEIFSVATFVEPNNENDSLWAITPGKRLPGDFGFDPLGLKPTNPQELKELQTKELNNGRLAMIAAAGMIAQELATGQKLF